MDRYDHGSDGDDGRLGEPSDGRVCPTMVAGRPPQDDLLGPRPATETSRFQTLSWLSLRLDLGRAAGPQASPYQCPRAHIARTDVGPGRYRGSAVDLVRGELRRRRRRRRRSWFVPPHTPTPPPPPCPSPTSTSGPVPGDMAPPPYPP